MPGGAFFESILKEKKPFKSLAIRICAAFLASLVIIGLSVYYFISVSFKQLLTNHTTNMLEMVIQQAVNNVDEAAIPRHGERTEPLFSAILRPAALNKATAMLKQDNRRLMDFFRQLNTSYVESQEEDFQFNLNMQEDYQAFLAATTKAPSSFFSKDGKETQGDESNE